MSWLFWLAWLGCAFVLYPIAISIWDMWQARRLTHLLNHAVRPKAKLIYEWAPWLFWRAWRAATAEHAIQKQR